MLKKFINGLIFGAGFAIAFLIVWVGGVYFILPPILEKSFQTSQVGPVGEEQLLGQAPPIRESRKFLGSTGVYSEDFMDNKGGVLAAGKGAISGSATVNGKPLEGLKLKLALNGSVMSQWATTDSTGTYNVSVPYGEYKIDGFELDDSVANKVLPGKIDHPENRHATGMFQVSADEKGRGLHFRFVDPIIKRLEKTKFASSESIILKWEPYPEATNYTIQIFEKTDPDSWRSTSVFKYRERPSTAKASLDLSKHATDLKPGYFYAFTIQAKNANGDLLSATHRDHTSYDFEITE